MHLLSSDQLKVSFLHKSVNFLQHQMSWKQTEID